MNDTKRYLAFDLGAESGRAVLGTLADDRITLEEIHRFPTQGIVMLGTRQWDVTRIYGEMIESLRRCARDHTPDLDGIAVDTWGVDFGLIASDGSLLANPVHYRDKRTEGVLDRVLQIVSREDVYGATGIAFMPINTIYQLRAMVEKQSPLLDVAESLLMMNDLFSYLLCGARACEFSNASTTQMLDMRTSKWNTELITRLGIPRRLLLDPVLPGTVLGPILPEIAQSTGISPRTGVIATCAHDTAAAVAAVPVTDGAEGDWAFLSSGTWSLLGAEIAHPVISEKTLAANFTNEGGVEGKITFLKNIIGLWLIQECRRSWELEDGRETSYATLTDEAARSEPFASLIDVGDPSLLAPEDMPSTLRTLCARSGQPEPLSRRAIVRCALESLALKYRRTLRELDEVLGRKTARLHIIGGGAKNKLLTQMTADACGLPVIAGPAEGTALGNIAIQAIATGTLASLAQARKVVADSVEVELYEPRKTALWAEAEARLH